MQLQSLKVRNWKAFEEYFIEFSHGINIIHGPNEVGKSSLQEAIRAVFQTPVAPRGSTLVSVARPWGTKSNPEIEVRFTHLGKKWKIHKEFYTNNAELECDGKVLAIGKSVHDTILTELSSTALASVTSIQGDIEHPAVPSEIKTKVAASEALTSGVTWLENQLQKEYEHFFTPAQGRPRDPLLNVRKRSAEIESRVYELEESILEADRKSRELEYLDKDQAEFERRLDERELQVKQNLELLNKEIKKLLEEQHDQETWQKQFGEEHKKFLKYWKQHHEYQERLGFTASVKPPVRTEIENLKILESFLLVRRQELIRSELEDLAAPPEDVLANAHTLVSEKSLLEDLKKLVPEKASKDRRHHLRLQLKERQADLEKAQFEISMLQEGKGKWQEKERRVQEENGHLQHFKQEQQRLIQVRDRVLTCFNDDVSYQAMLSEVQQEAEVGMNREKIDHLFGMKEYLKRRFHDLTSEELEVLGAPDEESLNRLHKISLQVETLEEQLESVPQQKPAIFLPLIAAATGGILGFVGGSFLLQQAFTISLGLGLGLAVIGFFLGRFFKPDNHSDGPTERLGALVDERDSLLSVLGVDNLEAAELLSDRAKILEHDLLKFQVSLEHTQSLDNEIVTSLNHLERGLIPDELGKTSKQIKQGEKEWNEAQNAQQKHRAKLEEVLKQNPARSLDDAVKQLKELCVEFGEETQQFPEKMEYVWFEKLKQWEPLSVRILKLKGRIEDLSHEISPEDLQIEKAIESSKKERKKLEAAVVETQRDLDQHAGALKDRVGIVRRGVSKKEFTRKIFDECATSIEEGNFSVFASEISQSLKQRHESLGGILSSYKSANVAELDERSATSQKLQDLLAEYSDSGTAPALQLPAELDKDEYMALNRGQLEEQLSSLPPKIKRYESVWQKENKIYEVMQSDRVKILQQNPEELLVASREKLAELISDITIVGEHVTTPEENEQWFQFLQSTDLPDKIGAAIADIQSRLSELEETRKGEGSPEHPLNQARLRFRSEQVQFDDFKANIAQSEGVLEGHRQLYSKLTEATEKLHRTYADRRAVELESSAVKILFQQLRDSKRKMESELVGPLKNKIDARLKYLTNGRYAGIEMNADFNTQNLLLAGDIPTKIKAVSYGTQEQLAFLARLSLADLLGEEEGSLMIIDDSLVHTDDDRLEIIIGFMKELAPRVQFLMFTCHPERFISLENEAKYIALPPIQ